MPDAKWHYSSSPPIRFKVKNTSPRGEGPRRINSIHIITNAPQSAPMRPLDIYRTTPDGSTSAQSPTCAPRGANGLACDGLDAGPGDILTVDFTTTPNPYPDSDTITVIADAKVEGKEMLGDAITLAGPGPSPAAPPTVAPPPPSGAMTSGKKKKVLVVAKGASTVGAAIALYGAYAALSTGPAPEPVTKGTGSVLLVTGAALAFLGVTVDFIAELVDPFDPDYGTVPEVARAGAPRVSTGDGIPRPVARAVNRLAMNAGRVDAYGEALITAYDRAASATAVDDLDARSRQLEAGAGFARMLADLVDDGSALRQKLAHAIRANDLSLEVRPDRIPKVRRRLRRGPTPRLKSILEEFDLGKREIRKLTRQIANVELGSPLPRVTRMLTNERIAKAEHGAAAAFRQVARAFAAAA